jgi:hypothetical protein
VFLANVAKEQESANNRNYNATKDRIQQVNDFFLGADSYMTQKQKTDYAKELYTKAYRAGDTESAMKYGQDYLSSLNQTTFDTQEIRRKQEEYNARFGGEVYAQQVVDQASIDELKQLRLDMNTLIGYSQRQLRFFNDVRGNNGSTIRVANA